MKTAEEWMQLISEDKITGNPQTDLSTDCVIVNHYELQQIQLDAMKEGARRAAVIAKQIRDSDLDCMCNGLPERVILTTAEQWTEKDL